MFGSRIARSMTDGSHDISVSTLRTTTGSPLNQWYRKCAMNSLYCFASFACRALFSAFKSSFWSGVQIFVSFPLPNEETRTFSSIVSILQYGHSSALSSSFPFLSTFEKKEEDSFFATCVASFTRLKSYIRKSTFIAPSHATQVMSSSSLDFFAIFNAAAAAAAASSFCLRCC